MPTYVDARREAARGFFEFLAGVLTADEVLADKQCVRLIIDKAAAEHAANTRKRFDAEETFRRKLLYGKIDEALVSWCRRRDLRADPYAVFRFEGPERGPTQHETAIGPSLPMVRRAFDRLAERVPEIANCSEGVAKAPGKAIAPRIRLQPPLPFGAAGEVRYGSTQRDLAHGIYLTAMYAATGGDPSRGWRYDCGVLIFYGAERSRTFLGAPLFEAWPEVCARIWQAARVWIILL